MDQFDLTVAGTLTSSATEHETRSSGVFYVTFDLRSRRGGLSRGNNRDRTTDFTVICWGDLAVQVRNLTRGARVVVNAYDVSVDKYSDEPRLQLAARAIYQPVTDRPSSSGQPRAAKPAHLITTADGETYNLAALNEANTDFAQLHR
jgi:hypothetical protein